MEIPLLGCLLLCDVKVRGVNELVVRSEDIAPAKTTQVRRPETSVDTHHEEQVVTKSVLEVLRVIHSTCYLGLVKEVTSHLVDVSLRLKRIDFFLHAIRLGVDRFEVRDVVNEFKRRLHSVSSLK